MPPVDVRIAGLCLAPGETLLTCDRALTRLGHGLIAPLLKPPEVEIRRKSDFCQVTKSREEESAVVGVAPSGNRGRCAAKHRGLPALLMATSRCGLRAE